MLNRTRDLAWNPWKEFQSIQNEIDRALNQFQRPSFRLLRTESAPKANFWTNADGYILALELPGLDIGTLDITVEKDGVSIVAADCKCEDDDSCESTSWRRRFRLPDEVEPGRSEATYENGVLILKMFRPERLRPQRIAVNPKG